MTVGVAYRVPGYGAIIACDSRVTGDCGRIYTDADEKWIATPTYMACCSGVLGDVWANIRSNPPKTLPDLYRALRPRGEDKVPDDAYYEVIVYDRRQDVLVITDSTGDRTRKGLSAVTGCGGDIALGVVEAGPTPRTLEAAERLCVRAVKCAIKHNCYCGGRIRVLVSSGRRGAVTVR